MLNKLIFCSGTHTAEITTECGERPGLTMGRLLDARGWIQTGTGASIGMVSMEFLEHGIPSIYHSNDVNTLKQPMTFLKRL